MEVLVSTEWLDSQLGAPDLRCVDASFFLPDDARDARAEFEEAHIPGAVHVALEDVSDPGNPAPNMVPDAEGFAARMAALGIADTDRIIVYDDSPHHSAARLWWLLRSFGATRAAVLDGGLRKWKAEGRRIESGPAAPRPAARFAARLDRSWLADKDHVSGIVHSDLHELVDARGVARFAGEEPEPRPGVVPGHIPGSRNLPQARLFDPDNRFKRGDALRAEFQAAGIDLSKPMVTTCGSGVTAAVVLLAAQLLGKEDVKLYDGSWSEWGADPATPKSTGRA